MSYLVDTNVLSELRKLHAANAAVRRWAGSVDARDLYLSVVTVFEIQMGVLQLERRDRRQAKVLHAWLHSKVIPEFEGRILPIDVPEALRCAHLHVPDPCSFRDSLIAATALVHGMTVVTRDVKDFKPTGVSLLNPWED
jgi:toxin FitB